MYSREWVEHYKEVGLSREEHFIHVWKLIAELSLTIGALVIHGFAPRYFKNYYSNKIKDLNGSEN